MKADPWRGEGSSTPFESDERAATERSIARGLLVIRSMHLLQGLVCLVTGWKAYRRPRLALALFLAACAESGWLARRVWRVQSLSEPRVFWADTGFGMAGLAAIGATLIPEDRTAWMNWMCPLTIGGGTGASVAIEGPLSKAVPGLLGGVYLISVRSSLRAGGSQLSTALANTASYAGFYAAAGAAIGKLRSDSEKLERAREEALIERERLAAERQRNREHRMLHDSALQTLELVASGVDLDPETVRRQARREAAKLRRAISGQVEQASSLANRIRALIDDSVADDLHVELALIDSEAELIPERHEALLGALHEALTNVAKHAGVPRAIVTVACEEDGVRITIRDHGKGFDGSLPSDGFGMRNSIVGRLADVGGRASLDSAPGRGTKVTLWVPSGKD